MYPFRPVGGVRWFELYVPKNIIAREVASYDNEHFTLLAECIEAEDGIVDKFTGDSVMAFWGEEFQFDSAGEYRLKGHNRAIKIFKLR